MGRMLVIEGIATIDKKGLIDMHAAARLAKKGLGHKGSVQPMLHGDGAHHQFKSGDVVGGR